MMKTITLLRNSNVVPLAVELHKRLENAAYRYQVKALALESAHRSEMSLSELAASLAQESNSAFERKCYLEIERRLKPLEPRLARLTGDARHAVLSAVILKFAELSPEEVFGDPRQTDDSWEAVPVGHLRAA